MIKLTLTLLGTREVLLNEQPVSGFITAKAQALFFYLAVTGRAHKRDVLGSLLWPEVSNAQARKNLRDILPNLRTLVGSHLRIDRESVAFDRSQPYQIDVEEFRSTLETLKAETPLEQLRAAVDLYMGEFLLGFAVRDSQEFDEWLLMQREQLHLLAIRGLAVLSERCLTQKLIQTGLEASHRLLQFDPLHEQGVCNCMMLLVLNGARNAALSLYEEFSKQLKQEVGVNPLLTTSAMYEEIRSGQIGPLAENHAEQPVSTHSKAAQVQTNAGNLPRILTPTIGRTEEVRHLSTLLSKSSYPLITLVGQGGIGKTRLAIVTAQTVRQHFNNGVWFVSLAEVIADESAEQQLLYAIAKAVGYGFVGSSDAKSQLFAFLQPRQILLVLDNFEHLVGHADLVLELLSIAHELKILITARQRLSLATEYVYRVTGLSTPTNDSVESADWAELTNHTEQSMVESVALFIECANRATTTLSATQQTQQAIYEICQLVDGLPLAIELAAGLLDRYTCIEISQRLRTNYDILTTTAPDLPNRQRNMKLVLATSYALLSSTEQRAFAFCSIFQGGFTTQTALAVTGIAPDVLSALLNSSMIHRHGSGRLKLHPLMAQYAAEQLRTRSMKVIFGDESEQTLRDQHCAYFAAFLAVRCNEIICNQNTTDEITEELDNVRAAWQWGLNRQRSADLLRAQSALFTFMEQVGYMHEADTLLRQSSKRVRDWLAEEDEQSAQTTKSMDQELLLRLLIERAGVCIVLGQTDEAESILAEAFENLETLGNLQENALQINAQLKANAQRVYCELAQALGDNTRLKNRAVAMLDFACAHHLELSEAQALVYLGVYWLAVGDAEQAEQYLGQVLAYANRVGHVVLEVSVTNHLATAAGRRGNISQDIHYLEESLRLARGLSSQFSVASALYSLATQFEAIGLYAQALTRAEEAAQIYRQIGSRKYEATVLCKLGALRYWQGEIDTSFQLCERSLRMAQRDEDREVEADCHLLRGQIYIHMQEFAQAMSAFQQALALFVAMGEPNAALLPRAGIAVIHWLQQDFEAARAAIDKVVDQIQTFTERTSFYPEILYLSCYHVLKAVQDARADDVLRNGYDRVLQQAAKLLNPNWRRAYFEEVGAVREIMRLATAQWQPGQMIKVPPGLFTRLPQSTK